MEDIRKNMELENESEKHRMRIDYENIIEDIKDEVQEKEEWIAK